MTPIERQAESRSKKKPHPSENNGPAADDLIDLYFLDIARELLTQDEEIALMKKIEAGKNAKKSLDTISLPELASEAGKVDFLREEIKQGFLAREKMILHNTRWVINIAKHFRDRGVEFPDLIQFGNEGLIKAVDTFNYRLGNRFSTVASIWIKQSIFRGIGETSRTIRVSENTHVRLNRLNRIKNEFLGELGREPTSEELAVEMKLSLKVIKSLEKILPPIVSIDVPILQADGSQGNLEEVIESNDSSVLDQILFTELQQRITDACEELGYRQAHILRMFFYDLDVPEKLLLEVMGKKYDIKAERVRQIKAKALKRLKKNKKLEELREG